MAHTLDSDCGGMQRIYVVIQQNYVVLPCNVIRLGPTWSDLIKYTASDMAFLIAILMDSGGNCEATNYQGAGFSVLHHDHLDLKIEIQIRSFHLMETKQRYP
jgi:hypothetical protein